jgi:carboxypeptidase Taq
MSNSLYLEYVQKMQQIADVNYAAAVLNWDQEIYLPEKGAATRSRQLATLSGISHELSVAPDLGVLLESLSAHSDTLSEVEKKNIAHTLKDYHRNKKYSTEFVIKMSQTVSEAYHHWVKARENADFNLFAPSLKQLVALKREEAAFLGYKDHPYDALLDQYEPALTTSESEKIFNSVKASLISLINEIGSKPTPREDFMFSSFPKDPQWAFGLDLLSNMGFDFAAGRQDISVHPFTINFSSKDVRVTTKLEEANFNSMTWSCLHEGGHALYEQGLPIEQYGLPCGEAISLGIHESQIRLWENMVGRSAIYWNHHFPKLQSQFPEALKDITANDFYKACNLVKPSFIRIEADELTYHFHVLIRFEIEKALIEGSLEVNEVPAAWNKKYKDYLGVEVSNDAVGCLQDIHWSHGSFGYFPTYSIGSFYAAQFFAAAEKQIPDLSMHLENGNMQPLLNWLRENIHQHGKRYSASELCQRITGEPLNVDYFIAYAKQKYGSLYSL